MGRKSWSGNWPPLNKVVVADAGPLIALARLHLLELLPQVFGEVLVTDVVLEECARSPDFPEAPTILAAMAENVMTRCVAQDFSAFEQEIDIEEASAIAVAIERRCGVLMDDKAGRRMAGHIGIPVIGTVGVLVLAKRKGLVTRVKPLLEHLVESGYFLSKEIIAATLAACDE